MPIRRWSFTSVSGDTEIEERSWGSYVLFNDHINDKIDMIDELIKFFKPDGLTLGEESWLLAKATSLRNEMWVRED
jgi:hypothetical protein